MSSSSLLSGQPPIDREHLDLTTLGDRELERDVLVLFRDQSERLLQRLTSGSSDFADSFAASVHTLKGSARAIGALHVVRAAEILETTTVSLQPDALRNLQDTVADARCAIDEILGCK